MSTLKIYFALLTLCLFVSCSKVDQKISIKIDCDKKYKLGEPNNIKIVLRNESRGDINVVDDIVVIRKGEGIKLTETSRESFLWPLEYENEKENILFSVADMPILELESLNRCNQDLIPIKVVRFTWVKIKPKEERHFAFDLKDYLRKKGVYRIRVFLNQDDFKDSVKKIVSQNYEIEIE